MARSIVMKPKKSKNYEAPPLVNPNAPSISSGTQNLNPNNQNVAPLSPTLLDVTPKGGSVQQNENINFKQDGRVEITTRTGQKFDLSKEEYKTSQLGKKGMNTANTRALEAEQAKQPIAPQATNALNQMGLTPEQQQRNVVQGDGMVGNAVTGAAAIGGAFAGAKAGAGVGAALAPFTGGLSVPIGAGIGAVGGALTGAYVKISASKRQDVKQAYTVFSQSKSNLGWIITEANAGRLTPEQAVDLWDEELANIFSAERNLKKDTATSLNRFLSGGADEAAKVQAYKARLPYLQQQLELALLKPNPNTVVNTADTELIQ